MLFHTRIIMLRYLELYIRKYNNNMALSIRSHRWFRHHYRCHSIRRKKWAISVSIDIEYSYRTRGWLACIHRSIHPSTIDPPVHIVICVCWLFSGYLLPQCFHRETCQRNFFFARDLHFNNIPTYTYTYVCKCVYLYFEHVGIGLTLFICESKASVWEMRNTVYYRLYIFCVLPCTIILRWHTLCRNVG